jgi:spore coat protein U-like protein
VSTTLRIKTALAAGAAFAALAATPAHAGTQGVNLPVSATVNANCTITASPLAFGNVNTISGLAVDGTGGVAITCTNGSAWTATADIGAGTGATYSGRRMSDGGSNQLVYNLYTASDYASVWGDGTGSTGTFTGTGTGSSQSITIYGRVPAGQTGVPSGSYSDLVAVTVTY